MSRPLSTNAKIAIFAPETAEIFAILMKVDNPGFLAPILITQETTGISHGGEDYLHFPFEVTMPDDQEGQIPSVDFHIENVSGEIIERIEAAEGPLSITMTIVLQSSPETIEAGPMDFLSRKIAYNQEEIVLELRYEDLLTQRYPSLHFTPRNFPGLFK